MCREKGGQKNIRQTQLITSAITSFINFLPCLLLIDALKSIYTEEFWQLQYVLAVQRICTVLLKT